MLNKKIAVFLCVVLLLMTGCANSSGQEKKNESLRDNTPVVKEVSTPGTQVLGNDVVDIDVSHSDQGYIVVEYNGKNPKVKIQITTPDQVVYTYDKYSGKEVFPLTGNNGNYVINIFENISGTSYSKAYSGQFQVNLENEYITYLYPNQYVNFNASTKAIQKGKELAKDCYNDLDVVENVFDFMVNHIEYDYSKAKNVENGYIPVVDHVLEEKKGICFDYAALMATMLRTQQIPTRLEIGYAGEIYHAWISVYTKESGWIEDLIQFDGKNWQLMDPTFLAGKLNDEKARKYVSDKSHYQLKYKY